MATSENRLIPCKIGDEVYAVRSFKACDRIYKGKVTQMYFVGEEMKLAIVVNAIARGEWGKSVFATEKEARMVLKKCTNCKHFVGCEKAIYIGICEEYDEENK